MILSISGRVSNQRNIIYFIENFMQLNVQHRAIHLTANMMSHHSFANKKHKADDFRIAHLQYKYVSKIHWNDWCAQLAMYRPTYHSSMPVFADKLRWISSRNWFKHSTHAHRAHAKFHTVSAKQQDYKAKLNRYESEGRKAHGTLYQTRGLG